MSYIKISSRQNEHIKFLSSLKKPSVQVEHGIFLLEGEHLVTMAFEANILLEVLVIDEKEQYENVKTYLVTKEIIEKLSSLSSIPKVIGVGKFPTFTLTNLKRIVYLDDVQDPGNVGTLLRSALAFKFDAVIASPNSANFFSQKALMAAQGASLKIPCLTYTNEELLAKFSQTHTLIATAINKEALTLDELNINPPFVLILGSEGQGINEHLLTKANKKVYLPMHEVDSINVAAAGAIFLYHLRG